MFKHANGHDAIELAIHHARHRQVFGKFLIEQPLMRNVLVYLATIIAKYWINKQAPQFIYEAMECHGGAGYIEESLLPRLYREAPVNSIWEGSGNVICLDLLRVINRASECLQSFNTMVRPVLSEQPVLQKRFQKLQKELERCQHEPALLRRCVESMALLL